MKVMLLNIVGTEIFDLFVVNLLKNNNVIEFINYTENILMFAASEVHVCYTNGINIQFFFKFKFEDHIDLNTYQ